MPLVFVGLLLGSWRMSQEPWRPLLFFLAIVGLLLARGAGALAATVSLAGLLLGSWRMTQEPWRLPTLREYSSHSSWSYRLQQKTQERHKARGRLWGLAAGDRVYGLCCPLLVKLRTPLGQRAVPRSRMASTTRAWYSQAVVNTTRWLMHS